LTDTTQNDSFQDKYFSNIDLDLSKALFIFSYNDVEQVDKILLDRIHRIKFENLHLNEKLIICEKFLLPELYKNFGLNNVINFDKDLIIFIIENYTNEPGVRKLKELLFEIISSINLDFIKNSNTYDIPFNITKELIQKILKDKHFIRYVVINTNSQVGLVNGMWANAYGNSGILHIETKFFCTNTCFELKLTGMQGDVMKESMNVSKTLAWNLLKENEKKSCLKKFEESKEQGIHIHVPEGATPKDGPSAGAGITLAIYSLLVNKKIRNNYAITGEICLNGKVTAIGGLDLKILGGIRAGVKSFLYPKENHREFQTCYEKYKEKLAECQFYEVSTIHEVIKYMLI
jgi:ATP-dependent Lon protease